MGLSRLDNFLKSSRGTILYVDPNSLDATDSIENQGNSLTRPFKTIQRALIESARFSYQAGLNNDRFGKTTILLYPGDHVVDNRPGFIPDGLNNYRQRNGSTTDDLPALDLSSNLNLESPNNELYKLNSIHGGVILPRGTSLVGLDLRKTKIRPKYVPDPENDNITRTAIFRVTGACYLWQFSIFDGDPNGVVYKDYTVNTHVPNFSHHKLTVFEYADGVNGVNISDTFQSYSTTRTDLDMYYEKVGLVYGQSSGRAIEPDYPSTGLDIQPKIDEFRIVGSTGQSVGISSIKAGDGVTATTTITVTTDTAVPGLDVDTPFRIEGLSATGYNGQFVVFDKTSSTELKYIVQNTPTVALPTVSGSQLSLSSDTVTSASPYIFNISLRSVFGMCGMEADGSKATGFKSMVVAQYTGIGLQKDDNAFVRYNTATPPTGNYDDRTSVDNLSNNSTARYKPEYRNFHVKVSNNSFIQAVSIFAIGFSEHFVTENGGDISLTNSNSNFGANALTSVGFRTDAFSQDDIGYVTHIIPPKEVPLTESAIEFNSIDVAKTDVVSGVGSTGNLYLLSQTNAGAPPENVIEGFRVGTRTNDQLRVLISQAGIVTEYSARIVMPDNTENPVSSGEKIFNVKRSAAGINSIGSFSDGGVEGVITLTGQHNFLTGESVRVISSTGQLPDGLITNNVAFAITTSSLFSGNTNIQLAKTLNDAINGTPIPINEKGGELTVVSRVSDKNSGDIGHPIQYDSTNSQWYVKVALAATENSIYPTIVSLGTTDLGTATPRTFFKRRTDVRSGLDKTYRMRYVIPSDSGIATARPPVEGFILQESNTSIGSTDGEIQTYFGSGVITNVNQQRNFRFIAGASWDGTLGNINTELPHGLKIGNEVELKNITSTENTSGTDNSGFNGLHIVTGISSAKQFSVGINTNPGTFSNNTTDRSTSLPFYRRKKFTDTYYVYRISESRKYIAGKQDGVYYLSVLNASIRPTVSPFTADKYSQPVKQLFPQISRDNPVSDPAETKSFAASDLIGRVDTDDTRNSITKEALNKYRDDFTVGIALTDIFSTTGAAHTFHTQYDHGLNRLTKVQVNEVGAGYSNGTYYNASLVAIGSSTTGKHATAKVVITSNAIDSVTIMDGGSAYGIGNTLAVTGVTTNGTSGYTDGVVEVTKIYDNVGDVIRLTGVSSEGYSAYNQLYRITDVTIGSATTITVATASSIASTGISSDTIGVGVTLTGDAYVYLTGESIRVNTFTYTGPAGIATITTHNQHGLAVDRSVTISGAGQTQYNGSFVVTKVNSLTSFEANLGVSTLAPTASGTIFALPEGVSSSGGNITIEDENIAGRMTPNYAGITTTISNSIANATTDSINIQTIGDLDINIGDFLLVDSELMRVKTTTTGSNPVKVFRGILGTKATSHVVNSVIRKVRIDPIELRRHSIIRASGHTFEYVGFGPGNYSTAFPDKHDRAITVDEELLAQSNKREGGINFYTGMNDKGISYSGNKRLSTITGREEIFDTPVETVEGEDVSVLPNLNVVAPVELVASRSITVEGGPDNKVISKFNGPVIINNKLTVNSTKGFETNNIFIQGDATVSRKYTVGIATPALAGNPGDVVYDANPSSGGYLGWVYTVENGWRRFGNVSTATSTSDGLFDTLGVSTSSITGDSKLQVGSGTSIFAVDANGVGIGSTANGFKLRVVGESRFSGSIVATAFTGDGSGLTNLANDSLFDTVDSGIGTGIFPTSSLNVGIGTTRPLDDVNLTVGAVGSSGTTMHVFSEAKFAGIATVKDLTVTGFSTVVGNFDIQNSSGQITAGVVTATTLNVGAAGTIITTQVGFGSVGIGSTQPTAMLDVGGHTKFTTYSEVVASPSISVNEITFDLSTAQSFTITASDDITAFVLSNVPSGSTSFTVKILQDSTGNHSVGIDTFKDGSGTAIPVFWPGGVLPIVTPTADRSDIYSFKTFDGDNITTSGLYGVVGGQNFA